MQVGAIGGSPSVSGGQGAGRKDPQSDAIRKQIEETKKQIRSVSQNESLTPEEKLEKQNQLREKLTELQRQLAQRQRDLRQEQRERAEASAPEETAQKTQRSEETAPGTMDPSAAQGIVERSTQLSGDRRFDRVVLSMEGRARVLQSEIEQDGAQGGRTSDSKAAELSGLQDRIKGAGEAMADGLTELSRRVVEDTEENAPAKQPQELQTPAEAAQEAREQAAKDREQENATVV